ncbi:MAG TPA: methyltransferase domain-containing protein [Bradyrhizobium sp.]|nr:methyltransferase domain-containing protein [Bradyrhizobium sp.]
MDDKTITKTVISDEIRRSSQPWLELDPNRDKTGLTEGDDTLFQSLAEKQEYYKQPLFGKRFSTANYLKPEVEFNQMAFVKSRVKPGGRLLLIIEALAPTGLMEIGHDILPGVEIVPLEVRPYTKARASLTRQWSIYREFASLYKEGEFDAVIASQMHHCDDYVPEFRALARLIKPGGRLVLVEYGPTAMTFELAKQDPQLAWLLRIFVTWAGARRVPVEQAYEYQKKNWLAAPLPEIIAAAHEVMVEPHVWEYKTMAIVDGVCKQS